MTMLRMTTILSLAVLLVAITGCPQTSEPDSKTESTVGTQEGGAESTESGGSEGDGGKVEGASMKMGVLNVIQALPLFVAQEKGYFAEQGLEVELVPFESGADKNIAMASSAIDGNFADLFSPMLLEGNGTDISIVYTTYINDEDSHLFAIVGKKDGGYSSPADMDNVEVAISEDTVINYVTEKLLIKGGLGPDQIATLDIKNIGLRMQNLMSGQVPAATLPEPLVSAAVGAGCTIVADDRGMEASQTVVAFRQDYIDANGDAVAAFLKAVDKANSAIADEHEDIRTIMLDNVRMPENLRDSFPMPQFPVELPVPSEKTTMEAVAWLEGREVIEPNIQYTDLVNGEFLP